MPVCSISLRRCNNFYISIVENQILSHLLDELSLFIIFFFPLQIYAVIVDISRPAATCVTYFQPYVCLNFDHVDVLIRMK